MSLRRVYEGFESSLLIRKGEIILETRVKPLLRSSREYQRISAFFSPTLIKAIFTELTVCLRAGGTIKLVIGIHDAGKLIPVLREIDNPDPQERFTLAVRQILQDDIEASLQLMERSQNIPLLFAELIRQKLIEVRFAAVKNDYHRYLETGNWPENDSLFHPKVSLFRDGQDVVALSGSVNETNKGYGENIEQAQCFSSWDYPELVEPFERDFKAIWNGTHGDTQTLPFSNRFLELIKSISRSSAAFRECQNNVLLSELDVRQLFHNSPLFYPYSFQGVRLLPHQRAIYQAVLSRWPVQALIADEVGLGKTIEAGAVISYLLRFAGLRRTALLVPASLRYQWQTEMYNLFGLEFYVYEPQAQKLVLRPNNMLLREIEQVTPGTFFEHGVERILFSWHFLRLRDGAGNYKLTAEDRVDLLLVDEAHAARLKRDASGELVPTKLYSFLEHILPHVPHRLLLTATPQQTDPLDYHGLLRLVSGHEPLEEGSLARIARLNRGEVLSTQQKMDAMRELTALGDMVLNVPAPACDLSDPATVIPAYSDALYIGHHPTTLFTLRNSRESLQGIGYRFPEVLLYSRPVDIPGNQARLFRLVHAYIERMLFHFERTALGRQGIGFIRSIYSQRIVSSLKACLDTLSAREDRLRQIVEDGFVTDRFATLDEEPEDGDGDFWEAAGRIELDTGQLQEAQRELGYIGEIISNIERSITQLAGSFDPKINMALEIIQEHLSQGNQVIVFSRFTSTTDFLVDKLREDRTLRFGRFQGNLIQTVEGDRVEHHSRTTIAAGFRRGDFPLMICSDAASEGLNLQAANVLVNIDVPWNPARLLQRFGRIDRFGQRKATLYFYNLFYPGTIEDSMYSRLHERNEDFRTVLGATPDITTREHLDELRFQQLLTPAAPETTYRNTLLHYPPGASFRVHELVLDSLRRCQGISISPASIQVNTLQLPYSTDEMDADYLDLNHPVFTILDKCGADQQYPVYSLVNGAGDSFFHCVRREGSLVPLVSLESMVDYLLLDDITLPLPSAIYTEENLGEMLRDVLQNNRHQLVDHEKFRFSEEPVSLYEGLHLVRTGSLGGKVTFC